MARILIVDDAPIMRKNLHTIMIHGGHAVVAEAGNGAQAYLEYVNHKPDLVTMDITMPHMNGLDTIKKIIGEFPDAKIVVISSSNNNKIIFECLQAGAKNYILKPFVVERVLDVINQVLHISEKVSSDTIDSIYKDMERTALTPAGDKPAEKIEEKAEEAAKLETVEGDKVMDVQAAKPDMFSIELKNNTFVIVLNRSIDSDSLPTLSAALQPLLWIKPLKVVFNLYNFKFLEEAVVARIAEYANQAVAMGGSVKIISPCKEVVMAFMGNKINPVVNFYSDISAVDL